MDSSTITPVICEKKSHKKIKVKRRPSHSSSTINPDLLDEFNISCTTTAPKNTEIRTLTGNKNINDRNNRISKSRQCVIGDNIVLHSWSRQSMFVDANVIKLNGPKSLKRYAIHAFSHDKATPYLKKKYKKLSPIIIEAKPHSILSNGTVENSGMRRYILEDIMTTSVGEKSLLLVTNLHPYWGLYSDILHRSPLLPIAIRGVFSFWQIPIICVKNAQLNTEFNKESIMVLLYGSQRGGIVVEFTADPNSDSVEITCQELFCKSSTIQIWGYVLESILKSMESGIMI